MELEGTWKRDKLKVKLDATECQDYAYKTVLKLRYKQMTRLNGIRELLDVCVLHLGSALEHPMGLKLVVGLPEILL